MGITNCKLCGKEITPVNLKRKYCIPCSKIANRMNDKRRREINAVPKIGKVSALRRFCYEIAEYNEKHGTNLSYGKYVAYKNEGKI